MVGCSVPGFLDRLKTAPTTDATNATALACRGPIHTWQFHQIVFSDDPGSSGGEADTKKTVTLVVSRRGSPHGDPPQ